MKYKKYKTKLYRIISALPAIVVGLPAFVIAIWTFLKNWPSVQLNPADINKDIQLAAISSSALLTSFVFDRLFLSRDLEDRLDTATATMLELKAKLTLEISARHLEGDEIYASRAHLWSKMQVHARTMLVGGPKAPDILIDAIARRLDERKRSGNDVQFDVVLVIDKNVAELGKIKSMTDSRNEIFKRYGTDKYVNVRVIESIQPLNLDVLIIDENHVNMGFPIVCNTQRLMRGLEFEEQPVIAKDLISWFDTCVFPRSTPFDEWYRSKMRSDTLT